MEETLAMIAACEDMYEEGLNVRVLQYWQTGFPTEISNN